MQRGFGLCASFLAGIVLVGATGSTARARAISAPLASSTAGEPLFFAGGRTEGLPLTAVLRRSDSAEYVSFVYGDCVPESDAGCAPPIEIQTWPACRRHLAMYETPTGPAFERVTVRGVPGAILDNGARLELQTGRSTVVVFADTRQRLARIAEELRPLDSRTASGIPLPPPVAGAADGRAPC